MRAWFLATLVCAGSAVASVETPYPGMTLVREPQSAMVIADLCSPGIQVRATKYSERQGTPQQWAESVGAQAAINADFFDYPGWTLVNGRARGGGEDWPADKQFFEARSYWQFGLFVADLVQDANNPPAGLPWVSEIVGGHNIIIRDGVSQGPQFDGDSVITTAHRRTAIGMSKDRRRLFLFSTDKSVDGNGLVAEMVGLANEAGGPGIDIATNMDGGGSSQLYVQGYGQIITSGRQVNNHLGIFARGSGFPGNCNNLPPRGSLDQVSCDGIAGWAQDTTEPDKPIAVHVYFDGNPGEAGAVGIPVTAASNRADLCGAIMSCNHGYTLDVPQSLLDGKPHVVHAWGIDTEGGLNVELQGSPKTFQCSPPLPKGQLRHVVSEASLAAWKLTQFFNVRVVSDAELAGYPKRERLPDAPALIRADGDPRVYVVDSGTRRYLSADAAAKWKFDLGAVQVRSAAEVDAFPPASDWPERPYLLRGIGGPGVYMVDVPVLVADIAPVNAVEGEVWTEPALAEQNASSGTRFPEATGSFGCSATGGELMLGVFAVIAAIQRRRR